MDEVKAREADCVDQTSAEHFYLLVSSEAVAWRG